jgi:hypothetical protein
MKFIKNFLIHLGRQFKVTKSRESHTSIWIAEENMIIKMIDYFHKPVTF